MEIKLHFPAGVDAAFEAHGPFKRLRVGLVQLITLATQCRAVVRTASAETAIVEIAEPSSRRKGCCRPKVWFRALSSVFSDQ